MFTFNYSESTEQLRRAGYITARQVVVDLKWTGLASCHCLQCGERKSEPLRVTLRDGSADDRDIYLCKECLDKVASRQNVKLNNQIAIERFLAKTDSITVGDRWKIAPEDVAALKTAAHYIRSDQQRRKNAGRKEGEDGPHRVTEWRRKKRKEVKGERL